MSTARPMTLEELTAQAKAAGFDLTPGQLVEIHTGYRHIAAMAARVRGAVDRPREAEPAHIFRPGFED